MRARHAHGSARRRPSSDWWPSARASTSATTRQGIPQRRRAYLVVRPQVEARPRLTWRPSSYHMGVGNLQDVIAEYVRGRAAPTRRLFFDSTPATTTRRHAHADALRRRLVELPLEGLRGARRSCACTATDPEELARPAGAADARRTPPRRCSTRRARRRSSPTPRRCAGPTTTAQVVAFPDDPARTALQRRPPDGRARRPARRRSRRSTRACGPTPSPWRSTSARRSRSYAGGDAGADRHLARSATRPTRTCSSAGTARPRATTPCTRPAGPSTSRGSTATAATRRPSSSSWTASRP